MKKYFLLILVISFLLFNCKKTEAVDKTNPTNKSDNSYKEIVTFEGNGTKNTESFYISKSKVKVKIILFAGENGGNLSAILKSEDDESLDFDYIYFDTNKNEDKTKGETESIYRKVPEGNYYLEITTSFRWKIIVYEEK